MRVVLGSTLAFATLVAVAMRHTFDGAGLIFCVRVYALGFGFGFIKLKSMFSLYQ